MQRSSGPQEIFSCFYCTRAFCTNCELAADIGTNPNHRAHRTIKLKQQVRIRRERFAQLRAQLKQSNSKLEDEKNWQIQLLNGVIDQLADELYEDI